MTTIATELQTALAELRASYAYRETRLINPRPDAFATTHVGKCEAALKRALALTQPIPVPTPAPVPAPSPSIFAQPGLFTDANGGRDPAFLYSVGFRWIIGQAWNEGAKTVDLTAFKQAGFKVGVWGLTYNNARFSYDGDRIASAANAMRADLLVVDAEECLKDADPTQLIRALAAFNGSKALSTLGAAAGTNVFPINYRAFLDAGYHILPQAYYSGSEDPANDYDGNSTFYRPDRCLAHAQRAGIPRDRVHLSINSAGPLSDAVHVALLDIYGVGKDISVFQSENGSDDLYRSLGSRTAP